MGGVPEILVIAAVAALVVVRQFGARKVSSDRRWWVLPAVLGYVAISRSDGALLDPAHQAVSAVLLGAGIAAGLVTGAGTAWTMRLWTGPDGTVWAKGRGVTAAVWATGIAVRLALLGIGTLLGVHLNAQATTLTVAALLLAQTGALAWRAGTLSPSYGVAAPR
ncbi:DUF1453 domain-containing protein [Streptomyces sp. Ru73]|uniref:DUF1453 domain-containing protein n=1 Tax=Streptomyces sp. Ru73 TaxID=2080748 RepID=UPI000CDDB402|nr:DUF1453 domain-containing protein [Streptomyces sp. Ru73]POX41062.1 DUF1453 domain-containing protein [Streptomyces sp. Ru73]